MDIFPAALSVLTWKAPSTLHNTLNSLAKIAPAFSERIVVCQEADEREIQIAHEHGFTPVPIKQNLGIQRGLAKCVAAPASENVLVLENDCPFLGTQEDTALIAAAIDLLASDKAKVVQMSRQTEPRGRYTRYWQPGYPPRRTTWGRLSRANAKAVCSDAMLFAEDGQAELAGISRYAPGLYTTDSSRRPWSNRPFLTTKAFFLGELIRFAERHPTSRHVNGMPDLEHAINSSKNRNWWRKNGFDVAFTVPGLFGHERDERPSEDEKGHLSRALTE